MKSKKPFFKGKNGLLQPPLRIVEIPGSSEYANGIPSGAKALFGFALLAARLKPCPFKTSTSSEAR
jgi:hypothetical protein